MSHPARGRYAPSPTGRLHLGNARTALLAWLQIRALGGRFVLRIEDVDLGRCRPAFEATMLADLRWLGLDWDEGPDVGGPFRPYRQSERSDHYEAARVRLDVYPCTCTRKELRGLTVRPGDEPVYRGRCRRGTVAGRPAAWRWQVPAGEIEVVDALAGTLRESVRDTVGDLVVRRTDGSWAYQLAVVVDDAEMAITHVLRGADLWTSTPRQILLQRTLGLPSPTYAHVPLVLGPDGEKLSKRHGAPDLATLREGGVDPRGVVAKLARSCGLVGDTISAVTARELVGDFDLERLRGRGAQALDWRSLGP